MEKYEQVLNVLNTVNGIIGIIAVMVASYALKRVQQLKCLLEREYWTKDVIGKTINAKTGKDPKAAEKMQEQILNGDVEEVGCKSVKDFCEELKKNVDNDPIPCSNPITLQLGFSYVCNAQKFYVYIGLPAFKEGQDDLPIKFKPDVEATAFLQKLIDHYKEKVKK